MRYARILLFTLFPILLTNASVHGEGMHEPAREQGVGGYALAYAWASGLRSAPKDDWIQVRSKNFYLIGNASEKEIRKVGTKLEQFRETFRLLFVNANLTASVPTNVIVFKNSAAYKPYKPRRANGSTDDEIAGIRAYAERYVGYRLDYMDARDHV